MKLPTFRKPPTFTVILPAMVLFSLLAYVLLGAFPGALLTGDFIAAIAQLPVISIHAFAAVGFTWFFHRWTFREVSDEEETTLHQAIRRGDVMYAGASLWLLAIDFARWFLPLCAFLIFFYPAR